MNVSPNNPVNGNTPSLFDRRFWLWRSLGLTEPDTAPRRSAVLLALIAVPIVLWFLLARGAFDFDCYWVGSWAVRDGRAVQMYAALDTPNAQGLYDLANATPAWQTLSEAHLKGSHQLWGFIYPPPCAALFLPFTFLPRTVAILLWRLLNLSAYLAGIAMLLRLTRTPLNPRAAQAFVFLALVSPPFLVALSLGQITPLVTWTIIAGLYYTQTNHPMRAGLCLALGTVLKISPVVFIVWLLWRRQFTAIGAWAIGLVGLSVVSALITGGEAFRHFLNHCLPLLGRGAISDTNLSFIGLVGRILHLGDPHSATILPADPRLTTAKLLFYALLLAGTAFAFWRGRTGRTEENAPLEYAVLNMVALLISPITWGHHLMVAALTLFFVMARGIQERRPGYVAAAGIAYFLMLQNTDLPAAFLPVNLGALLSLSGVLLLWLAACVNLITSRRPQLTLV